MSAGARGCAAAALVIAVSAIAFGQESTSAPLAKQLAAALEAAKLDSIAARDPDKPDVYVAALYFPGVQLLAVSARYSAPALLNEKLSKKDYRDVYIDLNSASVPDSKVFVEDLGAEGLKAERSENQPYDSYESAGKRVVFDGDWKKQKMSRDEYMKAFGAADEQYSRILQTLLAALKRTS